MKIKIFNSQFSILNCLVISCLLSSVFCLITGCETPQQTPKPAESTASSQADPNTLVLPVEIVGGGPFPSFLAGTWLEDGVRKRMFVFSKDGNLETMWYWLGRAPIRNNCTMEMPLRDGGKGIYKTGKWSARYAPETRMLEVEIVVDAFVLEVPAPAYEKLEGATREFYFGKISEDGKYWDVDYTGFLEVYATTEGFTKKMLHDPNEPVEESIVFEKILSEEEQ